MDLGEIRELSDKYYMNVFKRRRICFTHGEGNKLYDTNGKEYIDFVSGLGVNCLGYGDKELVDAISTQAGKLIHSSNLYYNEEQAVLCKELLEGTIFDKMFLANSGAEANECAIKLVRKHYRKKKQSRPVIITMEGSFHGRTLATLTATGQPSHYKIYEPLPEGFRHVPYGDFDALKNAVDDSVGAVMLEVIQSRSVITPAENDYLINAYAYCRSKDVLFIVDEIQTGMGRTGKMFAYEHFGIKPDIITLAKGMGGGLPISAVLARGEVADSFEIGDHGSTLSGNQLACAAATVVVKRLKNGLLNDIAEKGRYLTGQLAKFSKYKFVESIKGMGLLQGIKFCNSINGNYLWYYLVQKGILVSCTKMNVLRLLPPFTITYAEIDEFISALTQFCAETNI